MKHSLTIATRESPLAIAQAKIIKQALAKIHPDLTINFLGLTTTGDKFLSTSLRQIGGKGQFVKELEEALSSGQADLAVHSMKDVPMVLSPEFSLPVIYKRDDPRDAYVSNRFDHLDDLATGAIVGTASLRRQSQILHLRPDLNIKLLRGNINTRLRKLDDGEYDAIILAASGLKRMNFLDRIKMYLEPEQCLPPAGQGALGIEIRSDDEESLKLILPINDLITYQCVSAERAVCRYLGGGCSVPIAAYAQIVNDDQLYLNALVADPMGKRLIRTAVNGKREAAEQLGIKAGENLSRDGALAIIHDIEKYEG